MTLPAALPTDGCDPEYGVADFEPLAAASVRILDAATAAAERDPHAAIGTSPALQVLGMTTPQRSANLADSELVIRAAAAASALAAAEREVFDLFICDLSLPDGSGLELLPGLRSCSQRWLQRNTVPAIAISGSVYEEDIARCLEVGFTAHVAKPFDEEQLLAVIGAVTGRDVASQGTITSPKSGIGGVLSPVPARHR
jgi:CheY-like chemotaxis protein